MACRDPCFRLNARISPPSPEQIRNWHQHWFFQIATKIRFHRGLCFETICANCYIFCPFSMVLPSFHNPAHRYGNLDSILEQTVSGVEHIESKGSFPPYSDDVSIRRYTVFISTLQRGIGEGIRGARPVANRRVCIISTKSVNKNHPSSRIHTLWYFQMASLLLKIPHWIFSPDPLIVLPYCGESTPAAAFSQPGYFDMCVAIAVPVRGY